MGRIVCNRIVVLGIAFVLISLKVWAQTTDIKHSLKVQSNDIPVFTVPKEFISQMKAGTEQNTLKYLVVGYSYSSNLSPYNSGRWYDKGNYNVWACGIHSFNAKGLSVELDSLELHAGARIYVYNTHRSEVYGPYSRKHINKFGKLILPVIKDELIYIEYHVPVDKLLGDFRITSIDHEFADNKDDSFGQAGYCNKDINCYDETSYQKTKNAIVRLRIKVGASIIKCTGNLLNNALSDGTPYVLTANHCISNQTQAEGTLIYFNYESPYCDGPDGDFSVIQGADHIAAAPTLDFSLIKLSSSPGFGMSPYYAGWTLSNTPPEKTYCIHHPGGDVKKIAITENALGTESYSTPGYNFDENAHWIVYEWTEGTTEGGSSGSGLFNENDELVGTLSGGDAYCYSSYNDYYQKFNVAWDTYPDSIDQLKHWLDPNGSGYYSVKGYDPYKAVRETADTLSNIPNGLDLGNYSIGSWGYLTGHSSLGGTQFAEQFYSEDKREIFGINLGIASAYASNDSSEIIIKVWNGDFQPFTIIYEQNILIDNFLENNKTIIEFNEPVEVHRYFFVGYQIKYNNSPLDTFSVKHSTVSSVETTWVYNSDSWATINEYAAEGSFALDIQPVLFDSIPTEGNPNIEDFDGMFFVYLDESIQEYVIRIPEKYSNTVLGEIINIQGVKMGGFTIKEKQTYYPLNTEGYRNGIYFVNLYISNEWYTNKLLISIKER